MGTDTAGNGAAATTVTTTASTTATTTAAGTGDTALSKGAEKLEIPEKYQVKDKDGKIDEQASMRAVVKAHTELTKRMVEVGLPPESPDGYELTPPKGIDVAEYKSDPMMQKFLKSMHAQGVTNKQINAILNDFNEIAPDLVGAAQELSAEECIAQLGLTWKNEVEITNNIRGARLATERVAAKLGVTMDDYEASGLGNNPLFLRTMHQWSTEMAEDTSPGESRTSPAGGDWETQRDALQKELDALPESDRKGRLAAMAKITEHYEKKFGRRRAGSFAA